MEYVLYKKDSCPFCQKVLRFMNENKVEGIETKDIVEDSANKEFLIEKGGKNQVPCLFIDGKPLYESDDIIAYIKEHLLDGKAVESDSADSGMCPF